MRIFRIIGAGKVYNFEQEVVLWLVCEFVSGVHWFEFCFLIGYELVEVVVFELFYDVVLGDLYFCQGGVQIIFVRCGVLGMNELGESVYQDEIIIILGLDIVLKVGDVLYVLVLLVQFE